MPPETTTEGKSEIPAEPAESEPVVKGSSNGTSLAQFVSELQRFRHEGDLDNGLRRSLRSDATHRSPLEITNRKRKLRVKEDHSEDLPSSSTEQVVPLEAGRSEIPKSRKRRRVPSRYAPPSKYAHLPPLQDVLEPDLICVFVGTNPGIRTATAGHAYAHPSNLFWKLLHSSGCTDERLRPQQDVDLPRLYCMGNTNIVERPSRDAAELSKAEMAAGTPILEAKFAKYRPEAICIVGKGIWEAIWRWRYKREIRKDEFKYGWQDDKERMGTTADWDGAPVFVASSTSGLSASLRPHEKEVIWLPFGQWVKNRRRERRLIEPSSGPPRTSSG